MALLLGFALPSYADVPKLICYSGKITDKNGKIVADADYIMTFSLYDSQTNGALKWTETQTVNLMGGAYHVFLGSVNPNFPKFEKNYWLEVEFKGKTFGRQQIVSAPYAMRAQYANESESLVTAAMNLILPIGSIVAWHKTLTGTPALPETFRECDGTQILDRDSPYYPQYLPNLNGEKRFLRGSSQSGMNQADEFKKHAHNYDRGTSDSHQSTIGAGYGFLYSNTNTSTTIVGGDETRPINMSVVWIMRIK